MSLDINEQYDKIYRYCYIRVGNRETAEDLTQETFLRYLQHPQYQSVEKTLQLLYTIAGNLCKDEYSRRKHEEIPDNAVSDENIENNVINNIALSEALQKLSPEDREIILLRYVNDVPVGVMANIYSMSRFALNRRIKKILAVLHNELREEEHK